MDNLKEYINQNLESFNDQELPEGHQERFEAMLADDCPATSWKNPVIRRSVWWSVGIAAALAAVFYIGSSDTNDATQIIESNKDWFAGIGNDQFEICNAYYDKVAEFYETLLKTDPEGEMENAIDMIIDETIPLIDQLPEEMEPEARAAVLKEYYGHLLNGLVRIRNIK
ncbi:MAG: hypothetical protein J6Y06_06960 [Bacteroidales bacterium]|nr:hypothetical protein [Bacteroidales bacterium]